MIPKKQFVEKTHFLCHKKTKILNPIFYNKLATTFWNDFKNIHNIDESVINFNINHLEKQDVHAISHTTLTIFVKNTDKKR